MKALNKRRLKTTPLNIKQAFMHKQSMSTVLLFAVLLSYSERSGLASDIEIYQPAVKNGEVVIVMMLDTSGSMDLNASSQSSPKFPDENEVNLKNRLEPCDLPPNVLLDDVEIFLNRVADDRRKGYSVNYCIDARGVKYLDRISRLKDALYGLISSNAIQPSTRIGIGTFPYAGRASKLSMLENQRRGYMRIAADPWGEVGSAQRQSVLALIRRQDFVGSGSTPTAAAYAEAAAYMLGTNTGDGPFSGIKVVDRSYSTNLTVGSWSLMHYLSPLKNTSGRSLTEMQCDGKGIYFLTDGEPQALRTPISSLMAKALNINEYQITANSGLTGGRYNSWSYQAYWGEIGLFARYLNNQQKMTPLLGLGYEPRLRTAVVGFGSAFDVDDRIKKVLTDPQTQLSRTYYNCNAIRGVDARNACNWGEKSRFSDGVTATIEGVGGYGEGGFYSAKQSDDVMNSIINFIEESKPSFDPLVTGIPSVPVDALNPLQLHPYAYYATFVPKPEANVQLWQGNLNKYPIHNGELYSADQLTRLIKVTGEVNIAAQGGWGGGGMKMKIPLGLYINPETQRSSAVRKLYSNRRLSEDNQRYTASSRLSQVTLDSLLLSDGRAAQVVVDPDKNYWLNLLGFRVAETASDYSLATLPKMELRQQGAALHSRPILLTQAGKTYFEQGRMRSSHRQDYVLFGTMQGVLHVVDDQGQEVLAFVPYEMLERQKKAFLSEEHSAGGTQNLFYGIDGSWTARSQYVVNSDGILSVNDTSLTRQDQENGRLNTKGMQWVYGGLRMGGRSYYALDLTDLANPAMKFHIDPDNQQVVSSSLDEVTQSVPALQFMGQSWSKPTIAYIRWNGMKRMVMFVGGGYDATGEFQCGNSSDDRQPTAAIDRLNPYSNQGYECPRYDQRNALGAGVYMFDANSGQLLWWGSSQAGAKLGAVESTYDPNLKFSVVSQINTLDRDNDGLVDALYFGDLGGQVFRVDVDNNASMSKDWVKRVTQLYNGHLDNGLSPRFYEMPSFSAHQDKAGLYGIVALSSGNKSSPLVDAELSAQDGVFVIYDHDIARADLYSNQPLLNFQGIHRLNLMDPVKGIPRFVERYGNKNTPNTGWWSPYSDVKGDYKGLSEIFALDNILYTNVYYKNGVGIGGGCGARVQGDSYLFQYCLPTGKCNTKYQSRVVPPQNGIKIGAGIMGTHLGKAYNNREDSLGMIFNREDPRENCNQPEFKNSPKCQLFKKSVTIKHLRWYEQRAAT